MKKLFSILSVVLLFGFTANSQVVDSTTLEHTNAIIELDFPISGTVGEYRFQEAYMNDYTSYPNAYIPDSVKIGDRIWDSKGDRFVIVQINDLYPALDFEVNPLNNNGLGPNPGTGILFDPTQNLFLVQQTTNLPEKLKTAMFNHNMILIDQAIEEAATPQVLSQNQYDVTLSDNGGTISVIDADGDPTNELQDIGGSFDGTTLTLTLTDGNTANIDISGLQGTDNQNITATFNTGTNVLTLVMEDGNTQTVDLSSLADQQLSVTQTGSVYTVALEGGGSVAINIDDADADPTNEFQDISGNFDGTNLTVTLTDGNTATIDLSGLQGTDDQNITAAYNATTNIITLTMENGNTQTIDLSELENTDDQQLSSTLAGSVYTITLEDGSSVTVNIDDADADPTNEFQDISGNFDGTNLTVTLTDGNTATIDLSGLQGTDDQNITATYNTTTNIVTLTMEDGNTQTLDLTELENTDDQQLSSNLVGSVYTITLEDGSSVAVNINDADADPTNEFQDVSGTFDGTNLTVTLTDGNTATIDLSALQGTDDQNITAAFNSATNVLTLTMEDGNTQTVDLDSLADQQLSVTQAGSIYTVALEGGGTIAINIDDADADPTNEFQDISGNFDGTNLTVTLTDGNTATIDLSALQGTDDQNITATYNTTTNIVTLTMEDGNTQTLDLTELENTDDQQLSSTQAGNIYTITLEDGSSVTVNIDDADADPTNEFQDISGNFDGTNLTVTLTDGNTATIDLSGLQGTDDQNITAAYNTTTNIVTLTMEDGNTQTIDLTELENTDDQQLSSNLVGSVYTITLEDGSSVTVNIDDADADPTNEFQDVSGTFDGTNLNVTLTDGNTATIDLSALQGTDDQNITASYDAASNVITLTMEDGNTQTVDLSDLESLGYFRVTGDAGTQYNINDGETLTLQGSGGINVETVPSVALGNRTYIQFDGDYMVKDTVLNFDNGATGYVMVKVNGLASEFSNVTMTWSSNIVTITTPVGIRSSAVHVQGSSGDINSNTSLKIRIVDNNGDVNQTLENLMPGSTDLYKKINVGGNFVFESTHDNPPSSKVQTRVFAAGTIEYTFNNVDSYAAWLAAIEK